MLGALELVADKAGKTPFDPALAMSDRLFRAGYDNGIIFRAFTDGTIGLAPALSCTEAEMETLLARLRRTLDNMLETKDIRAAIRIPPQGAVAGARLGLD
jgi:adenosylmethionine-8-amino-7-oxononanoate aminotransferase